MTSVRDATAALFRRYLGILRDSPEDAKGSVSTPGTGRDHLIWMCETALSEIDTYPVDKLSRWLGFVQGVLTMFELITVDEERDFSRPLFHAAYAAEGTDIPPSRGGPGEAPHEPSEHRYDVCYGGGAPRLEHHFCREWDEDGGCFGSNPEHGLSWREAVEEVAAWHRAEIERWRRTTEAEWNVRGGGADPEEPSALGDGDGC
jgi:hypothetical protein